MKKTVLKQYAKLIAQTGGNVQKGQQVIIQAELDQPEFVYMLVQECYRCGAEKVTVEWNYQPLTKLNVQYQKLKTLSQVPQWQQAKLAERTEKLPVMIYLVSEDPDGLNGINQVKLAKAQQARYSIIKPYRDKMENKYQWCIAAVPGAAWARKLFPSLRTSAAIEKLWEAILHASRADNDDPIAAWSKHNADLEARCAYLNAHNIETLVYKSKNGTDLRVGLIENAVFMGGGERSLQGFFYNPNIPTEEVFITPMRGKAEGIVYSTKPLSYQGQLIENFSIRFENGKAVQAHAEKNEALLQKMIHMDEGAAYLGECALIPYNSPINESGLVYYNTLFDENASCHLALGMGFTNCIRDYAQYTLEQCREMGINDSMIHEDFMIGTSDLDITAITRDGKHVPVFRGGTWAF